MPDGLEGGSGSWRTSGKSLKPSRPRVKLSNSSTSRSEREEKSEMKPAEEKSLPASGMEQDRLRALYQRFAGRKVILRLLDGKSFDGILGLVDKSEDGSESVIIELSDEAQSTKQAFEFSDVAMIKAVEDLVRAKSSPAGFKIDSEISLGRDSDGIPELERWKPDEDNDVEHLHLESSNDSKGTWDQFATNKKLFGVETSFDENLYTTPIDRESEDYKKWERKAAREAREIMLRPVLKNNIHMMEERGTCLAQDGDDDDEEARYGAVLRTNPENRYVPPSLRSAARSDQPLTNSDSKGSKSSNLKPSALDPFRPEESADSKNKVDQTDDAHKRPPLGQKPSHEVFVGNRSFIEAVSGNVASSEKPKEPVSKSSTSTAFNPNAAEFVLDANSAEFVPAQADSSQEYGAYGYANTGYNYDAAMYYDQNPYAAYSYEYVPQDYNAYGNYYAQYSPDNQSYPMDETHSPSH